MIDPVRIRLLLEGVVLCSIVLQNRSINLGVAYQKTPMENWSLDVRTWGIRPNGCQRFRTSFSSAGLCRLTPQAVLMNSISCFLLSLHLLRWFCMYVNGPAPHAEQNLGSCIVCVGSR